MHPKPALPPECETLKTPLGEGGRTVQAPVPEHRNKSHTHRGGPRNSHQSACEWIWCSSMRETDCTETDMGRADAVLAPTCSSTAPLLLLQPWAPLTQTQLHGTSVPFAGLTLGSPHPSARAQHLVLRHPWPLQAQAVLPEQTLPKPDVVL